MLCLEDLGVEATADFNYLEENDLKDVIVYTVEDGNEPATRTAHRLKPIQVKKLMALKFWSLAQPTHTPDVWKTFDPASLAIYATRPAPINSLSPSNYPGTPLPHGSPMTAVTTTTLSSHQEFTKSIKRSVTDYPEFKDDRQFHDWNLTFTAMAATHGVETVLTPSYSPPDTEAATLFIVHKKFLYGVFTHVLKTLKSRNILRDHQGTQDSQAIYSDLLTQYTKGAAASVDASALRKDITMFLLTDSWTKPLVSFLNIWNKKVGDLTTLQGYPVPNPQKRSWLEDAIQPHSDLSKTTAHVQTMEALQTNTSGHPVTLSWAQYYDVVHSAAIRIDHVNKTARHATRPKTQVNASSSSPSSNPSSSTPAATKDTNPSDNWLPYEEFKKLSPAEQQRRKQAHQQTDNYRRYIEKQKASANTSRQANQAQTQPKHVSFTEPPASAVSSPPPPEVNASTSVAQTLLSNRNTIDDTPPRQINMHGRIYHIKTAHVTYCFHQAQTNLSGSLIDGGANGGIGGSNVRELERTFRRADVSGIANNTCLLYTSPSPRDQRGSRMPSSA